MKCALLTLIFISQLSFAHLNGGVLSSRYKLPKAVFNQSIKSFETTFSYYAGARELVFYTDYDSDWAQSFARRWEADQVIVYGGVAAIKGITEDVLALAICHELGHLYGGRPWTDEYNNLSLEGQADYWSASCFEEISPKLASSELSLSARLVEAALVLTDFYASNRGLVSPRIDTPDRSQVSTHLRTHPSPQCRLDTIMRGHMQEPRPSCWFAGN